MMQLTWSRRVAATKLNPWQYPTSESYTAYAFDTLNSPSWPIRVDVDIHISVTRIKLLLNDMALTCSAHLLESFMCRKRSMYVSRNDTLTRSLFCQQHTIHINKLNAVLHIDQSLPDIATQCFRNARTHQCRQWLWSFLIPLAQHWFPLIQRFLRAIHRHFPGAAQQRLITIRTVLISTVILFNRNSTGGPDHFRKARYPKILQQCRLCTARCGLFDNLAGGIDGHNFPTALTAILQLQIKSLQHRLLVAAKIEMVHDANLILRLNHHRCLDDESNGLANTFDHQINGHRDIRFGWLCVELFEIFVAGLPFGANNVWRQRWYRLGVWCYCMRCGRCWFIVAHDCHIQQLHVGLTHQFSWAQQHAKASFDQQWLQWNRRRLFYRQLDFFIGVAAQFETGSITCGCCIVLCNFLPDLQRNVEFVAGRCQLIAGGIGCYRAGHYAAVQLCDARYAVR